MQLGATSTPTCPLTVVNGHSYIIDCALPGTPYLASIKTPSPTCVDCADAPELAVQVTVRRPVGMTFARILGQTSWNVGTTSVAAIVHARSYGIVTLRPPKPRTNNPAIDTNEKNITLNGGSTVTVLQGDVATNTNLYVPNNATMTLSPGFRVFHYDAYELWTPPPPGVQVSTLIQDPNYPIPTRVTGTTPTYADYLAAKDSDANCAVQQALVPAEYKSPPVTGTSIKDLPISEVFCYKPGIYQFTLRDNEVPATKATLLEPGVYFLDEGLDIAEVVVGGYEGGEDGVALIFKECNNQCQLTANSAQLLALNMGAAYPTGTGARATAAQGPQGLVQTSTSAPAPMTIMVTKDVNCRVVQPYPTACADSQNNTIKLPGGGALFVAGVQYAPSDNVKTAGNANGTGIVGQIIAWTLEYDAGHLNQESAVGNDPGVLRLDRACSPSTVCNP